MKQRDSSSPFRAQSASCTLHSQRCRNAECGPWRASYSVQRGSCGSIQLAPATWSMPIAERVTGRAQRARATRKRNLREYSNGRKMCWHSLKASISRCLEMENWKKKDDGIGLRTEQTPVATAHAPDLMRPKPVALLGRQKTMPDPQMRKKQMRKRNLPA